jgi:hypothetical protein
MLMPEDVVVVEPSSESEPGSELELEPECEVELEPG